MEIDPPKKVTKAASPLILVATGIFSLLLFGVAGWFLRGLRDKDLRVPPTQPVAKAEPKPHAGATRLPDPLRTMPRSRWAWRWFRIRHASSPSPRSHAGTLEDRHKPGFDPEDRHKRLAWNHDGGAGSRTLFN